MSRSSLSRLWIRFLLVGVAGLFFLPLAAAAEVVVVVNSSSDIDHLSKSQVINIYLGRDRELPDGGKAIPVDLPANDPVKAVFYRMLVNKDLDQMAAFWSRFVFSGSTAPPYQANDAQEVIRFVTTHLGAVGYLNSPIKDSRIKVVLILQ